MPDLAEAEEGDEEIVGRPARVDDSRALPLEDSRFGGGDPAEAFAGLLPDAGTLEASPGEQAQELGVLPDVVEHATGEVREVGGPASSVASRAVIASTTVATNRPRLPPK